MQLIYFHKRQNNNSGRGPVVVSHGFMTHSGNKQYLEPFMQLVFIKLYNREMLRQKSELLAVWTHS